MKAKEKYDDWINRLIAKIPHTPFTEMIIRFVLSAATYCILFLFVILIGWLIHIIFRTY